MSTPRIEAIGRDPSCEATKTSCTTRMGGAGNMAAWESAGNRSWTRFLCKTLASQYKIHVSNTDTREWNEVCHDLKGNKRNQSAMSDELYDSSMKPVTCEHINIGVLHPIQKEVRIPRVIANPRPTLEDMRRLKPLPFIHLNPGGLSMSGVRCMCFIDLFSSLMKHQALTKREMGWAMHCCR